MPLGFKTSGYVVNSAIVNTTRVTQMCWIRLGAVPGVFGGVIGFMQGLGSAVLDKDLVVTSAGVLDYQCFDGATKQVTGAKVLKVGVWYHVAAVADGTNILLYVDGVPDGSTACGNTYAAYATNPNIFVGGHGTRTDTTTRYIDGAIEDVAIWTEALTAAQIKAIAAGRIAPSEVRPDIQYLGWKLQRLGVQYDGFGARDDGAPNGTVWAEPDRLVPVAPAVPQKKSASVGLAYISPATTLYALALNATLAALPFISDNTIVAPPRVRADISNVTTPQIEGTAQQGLVVHCTPGTWTGPPTAITYQWRRCNAGGAACADIAGETGSDYIVRAADVGGTLRCVVTAS